MRREVAVPKMFDFEIGILSESPCRSCEGRSLLPECAGNCKLLARVQTILAGGVSCYLSCSPGEDYTLSHFE